MNSILLVCLIGTMTVLGAVASYFLKKASGQNDIIAMLKDKSIYIGAILYITAAILNVIALRFLDYSIVLPLTSITYIWTMLISYQYLHERLTIRKMFGIICILCGVFIIVR